VRCAFEEAHPDATCPICSDPDLTATMARDSAAHIDEVWALLELRDVTAVEVALEEAGVIIGQAAIRSWSRSDRDTVTAWAANRELPRPGILGTAHVAAGSTTSEADGDTFQECAECGQRIWSVKTGEDPEARLADGYPPGTLVGVDCPGAKEPARYAKRGKRAKAAKSDGAASRRSVLTSLLRDSTREGATGTSSHVPASWKCAGPLAPIPNWRGGKHTAVRNRS
jgi:hypothetical protein